MAKHELRSLAQLMRGEIWPECRVDREDVRDVLRALRNGYRRNDNAPATDVVVPGNHGLVLPW